MDGGAWWATAHGVAKSRTRPSDFTLLHFKNVSARTSLVVQWLRLSVSTIGDIGSIPGQGITLQQKLIKKLKEKS